MKPPRIGNTLFDKEGAHHPLSTYSIDDRALNTGRYFLIHKGKQGCKDNTRRTLETKWGFAVAETSDFKTKGVNESDIRGADALVYNELGVTLLGAEDQPPQLLQSLDSDYFITPEKVVHVPEDILSGAENALSTWGIRASGAINSRYTGSGVRLAVLDTGLDMSHPDFNAGNISFSSFVPGESIQDLHGHGTHCAGICCGSADENGQRYGVAPEAHIFAGKVLSNGGSGAQSWVLNGITWAAKNECHVISMSLGTPVLPGEIYDIAYERAARYALSKGALLVAAAGNNSNRSQNRLCPVSSPADCPSILAIGAIDEELNIANFSNREINPSGKIDFVAPGVAIHSSWPMPSGYRTLSGTSMATPHVAGIIALLWEKHPKSKASEIGDELKRMAKVLPISPEDAGAGLTMAP